MIRPLTGQVLLRILPETQTASGIEIPQRTKSPEEVQQDNHHPTPPPPQIAIVEAIGPWPRLENGLMVPPPFPAGAKVLVREGAGQKLTRGVGDRLKLVNSKDILAVIQETC